MQNFPIVFEPSLMYCQPVSVCRLSGYFAALITIHARTNRQINTNIAMRKHGQKRYLPAMNVFASWRQSLLASSILLPFYCYSDKTAPFYGNPTCETLQHNIFSFSVFMGCFLVFFIYFLVISRFRSKQNNIILTISSGRKAPLPTHEVQT